MHHFFPDTSSSSLHSSIRNRAESLSEAQRAVVLENGKRVEHGDHNTKSPQVVTLVPYTQQPLLGILKLMEAAQCRR
jgi:hypothetical protein